MAVRVVVCLLCVFISLVDISIQGDPYKMRTYDCKSLYWFTSDMTRVAFRNSTYNIKKTYSTEQFPALITIPANVSVQIQIELINSTKAFYTASIQRSTATCCSENVTTNRNCRTLSMSCPERCTAPGWSNHPDFYRAMDCDNCTCQYCYTGTGVKRQQFTVKMGSHLHLFDERFSTSNKKSIKIIQPRKDLLKPFQLPLIPNIDLLPLPQDGPLKRYFKITRGKGFFELNPVQNESLPDNGQIQIYFEDISNNTRVSNIIEFNIKWYSKLNCSVAELPVLHPNDPRMAISCTNAIQESIIYNVSNSTFQMWENKLYLKALTTEGDHNITITAMYKGLNDSQFAMKVGLKITVPEFSKGLLSVQRCKAVFNFNLLNYTILNIQNQELGFSLNLTDRPSFYSIDLPANKTTTFQLFFDDQKTSYTITATSSDCCGLITMNKSPTCFHLNFTCGDACGISTWPDFHDYYKFSECKGCGCSYCYIGDTGGTKNLSVSEKSHTYNWTIQILPIIPLKHFSILPGTSIVPTFSQIHAPPYPARWGSFLQTNYDFNSGIPIYTIKPEKADMIPDDGGFTYYAGYINGSNIELYDIWIGWHSPLFCNVSNLPWKYLNDLLLTINCKRESPWLDVFNVSNPIFEMEENSMYLNDLSAKGQFNCSIIPSFYDHPLTVSTVDVSVEVPAFSPELLSVYECKAVFNFNLLNYTILNIQNQELGFSINLTDRPSFYTIDLPANKITTFQLFFDNKTTSYTITATSSDCCGLITMNKSPTCFHLNFTCGDACGISTWPDPKDYYKFSECKGCGCSYCYIGDTGGTKNLSVSGKSQTYNWTIQILPIIPLEHTFILPRTSIVPTFSNFRAPPYPARWGSFLQTNYDFNSSNQIYTIKPEKAKMIPRDGGFNYYAGNISGNNTELFLVKVFWYSPLLCNATILPWRLRNDPLLSINCQKESLRPNVFNVSNPMFEMKGNKVYLKDLTAKGQFNLSIAVLHDAYPLNSSTVNVSVEVPAFSPELLSVYECKAVFNFNLLNYTILNIQNQELGFSLNLTDRPSFYIIDLPANKTTSFQLFLDNQKTSYTITATSSDCCGLISMNKSPTCFHLNFTCGDACGISTWPDLEDYYKFSECKGCGCSYCYIGDTGGTKNLSVSGKSQTYNWTIQILPITHLEYNFTLPRTSIVPTFSHFQAPPYPARWGSFLQTNYDFNSSIRIYTIKPEKAKMIPRDGDFNYYAGNISVNNTKLYLVKVFWYSPLLCNATILPWKLRNDPLLSINCQKESLRPNVFNVSNPMFEMKGNKVYLKDLTAKGQFNLSIAVLHDAYPLNSSTVNVSVEVPAFSPELFSVYECKAVFNFNLLNYTILNIQNQELGFSLNLTDRPSFYIIDLPANKTTTFHLFFDNQKTSYTITATSSDCCGLISMNKSPTCFHLNFTCGDACGISTWPDLEDYYKFSECKGCGCSYCYIGDTGGTKNLSVSGKSQTYNWTIQILPITHLEYNFTLPRTSIVPTFSHFQAPPYPARWGSFLQTNYDFNSSIRIYTIKPEKAKMIPRDGDFNYYAGNISVNNTKLYLVKVFWYSPLLCNATILPWKLRNDPLLSINCQKESLRPNVFNVSNPMFEMKGNKVYLKDLTAKGQFNLSIAVLHDAYPLNSSTVNVSVEVPAFSPELFSVYECKAVFNFNLLNYTILNIQNQELGFSLNLTDRPSFYIIDLPANKTTSFQLFFDNQKTSYTITATSSDCCGLISMNKSPTCFHLNFTCGDACGISTWPDLEDYYKFSECKGCGCSYCYIGDTGGTKNLSVSGKSQIYNWTIQILPITHLEYNFTLPRTSIVPTFSHFQAPPYPARWGSFLQTNYDFNSSNQIYTIKPEKAKMIPRDGGFNYYAGNISGNNTELYLVKVFWYSPLLCNATILPWKLRNDPLLSINCQKESLRPKLFNVSNPMFEMGENKMYLKDLTAKGQFNLSITALYVYPLTASTVNVSVEVPAFSPELLSVYECKAVFNFNLLNYTILNIQNQELGFSLNLTDRPSFYIIDLPANKTTTFQLFFDNKKTLYTIAATSSDCCGLITMNKSPTCFHLDFTCGDACGISTWPDPKDYYKFSECKGCGCSYCYIGDTGGTKNLSVSGKSQTYNWSIQILPITQLEYNLTLPRTSIFPTFSNFQAPPYPARWGSFLQTNYDFNSSNQIYTIKPEKAKMIPRDGGFNYYAGNISGNNTELFLVKVFWYSPLLCNATILPWKYLNDPLLLINCKKESLRPNVFNVSNPMFEMGENKMYLKDLTAKGQFNLSITVLHDAYPLTATTVNVSFEVDQIFMTKMTAVKEGKDRYIFTCYSNSTFDDLTYEWYWNEFKISKGLSTSMQNGKSQGKFVFDGLNDKESGNLTCTAMRKGFFIPATIIKQISTEDFPVVKLDTTSHIIKDENPVVVNCYSSPKYKNSKLVLKVNNQEKNELKVKISNEATISCYGENDFRRGEMKTLQIYVAIGKKNCPAETQDNVNWPETIADITVNVACIGDLSGNVSRYCSIDGNWESPEFSKCFKKSIFTVKSTLNRIASIGGNIAPVMEKLVNATDQNMEAEDISKTIEALDIISSITNNSEQVSKEEVQSFVGVISNLVAEETKSKWGTLQKNNNLTAASMLKRMEDFGSVVSQKINESIYIGTQNLVLELQKVDVDKNIQFPLRDANQLPWVTKSNTGVVVPSEILEDTFGANKTVTMNAVLFRNMTDLLPNSRNNKDSINSNILAISFGKPLVNLTKNISLTFSHLSEKGLMNPSCNFWDFKKNPEFGGSWSTEGCVVNSSNANNTICSCNHLTNFAILMKPAASYKERKVIGIITIIGCSISIFALVLTMIIYGICWKYVTSQDVTRSQSILLMNLCVSLIIGYMLFLILVKETEEKIVCTTIASLIHYFFLVSFFAMLSEGIDMAIALAVVFSSQFQRLPWFIALTWGGPLIIVGTTLAITKTEGFGNDQFCWLTSENNVNLAFIVPVLIIIAVNIICVILIARALLSAYCMFRKSVKERLRAGARAIGILTPLLGFTWVFGVFAINEDLVAFEYIFAVANSLQGLFIFLAHCVFNKQIRKNLLKGKKTIHPSIKSSFDSKSRTKITELSRSKKHYSSDDYLSASSGIRQSEGNGRHIFSKALRYSEKYLNMETTPYYINPTSL